MKNDGQTSPPTPPISFTLSRSTWLFVLFLVLYVAAYRSASLWLVGQWTTDKAYSHGPLIPFISLYLIWTRREFLASLRVAPWRWTGGLLLLLCAGLLIVGRVGAFVQIEIVSFALFLPAAILFLHGAKMLRALALPLFYLQFMIPWLDEFYEKIHNPFQLFAAKIGSTLLGLLFPVYTDGIYISLPHISLEVARECSGINFLTTVLAVGVPLVYLTQKTWKRALTVLALGAAITILANGLRVAIAGWCGEVWGPDLLHGPGHIFQGWSVAVAGWISLFLCNWLIEKMPSAAQHPLYERWKAKIPVEGSEDIGSNKIPPSGTFRLPSPYWGGLCVFLALLVVYLSWFAMPAPVPLAQPLTAFPREIGPWRGTDRAWLENDKFFPNMDEILMRTYSAPSGRQVSVFLGYVNSQSETKRIVTHRTKKLHAKAERIPTNLLSARPSEVNLGHLTVAGKSHQILFWYRFSDEDILDRKRAKLKLIAESLLQRRSNGAVILLAASSQDDGLNGARTDLESFLAMFAPQLPRFLP